MPAVSFAHYLGITTLVHVRYFSVVPTYGLATSARPEIGRVSNSRARKWWEKSQMNLNYLVLIRDAMVGCGRQDSPTVVPHPSVQLLAPQNHICEIYVS